MDEIDYHLFEPPSFWTGDPATKSVSETNRYLLWFTQQIPLRIKELRHITSRNTNALALDFSRNSLTLLSEFLVNTMVYRSRSRSELIQEKLNTPSWFHAFSPHEVLDDQTLSLCMDIGIYFAEVMRTNHSNLSWTIVKKDKRDVDYHQPVLTPFKNGVILNPTRIVIVYAYKSKAAPIFGHGLAELFDVWSKLVDD